MQGSMKGNMPKKNIRAVKKRDEPPAVPVQEALADYLATTTFKRLRKATQSNYRHFLGVFAEWCSRHALVQNRDRSWEAIESDAGIALHEINDQVVYCFLEHLKETHKPSRAEREELASWTLATYVKCIKAFLNWCLLDDEYCQQVQAITIQRIKKPKIQQEIIEIFSDEQIEALFEACKQEESEHLQIRDRAILSLLLDSGIREEELVRSSIGDVCLDAKDSYIKIEGKGGKYGEVGIGDQARRAISKYIRQFREPTVEYALKQLHQKLPARQQKQAEQQAIKNAPLFVSRYAQPLTPSGLYQIVKRLGRWAGIEGVRCSPHTFRHTFAVRFWRKTKDIKTLSMLLRHTCVATTETYLRSILQSEARHGAPSVLDELNDL